MRTFIVNLIVSVLFALPAYAQLNTAHNHLRPGDVLIKQQVGFIDSMQDGENKLWDFSRVKAINDSIP